MEGSGAKGLKANRSRPTLAKPRRPKRARAEVRLAAIIRPAAVAAFCLPLFSAGCGPAGVIKDQVIKVHQTANAQDYERRI